MSIYKWIIISEMLCSICKDNKLPLTPERNGYMQAIIMIYVYLLIYHLSNVLGTLLWKIIYYTVKKLNDHWFSQEDRLLIEQSQVLAYEITVNCSVYNSSQLPTEQLIAINHLKQLRICTNWNSHFFLHLLCLKSY